MSSAGAAGQVGREAQARRCCRRGRAHPRPRPSRRRRRCRRSCSVTAASTSIDGSSPPPHRAGGPSAGDRASARRGLGEHDAAGVDGQAEHLGAPHVDPDRDLPGHDRTSLVAASTSGPAPGPARSRRERGLDARLQLFEGGVHDAALGPALDESGQRDPQLDLEGVGDLGGAVAGGVEAVAPVELGGEVAGGLLPGQGAGRVASSRRPGCCWWSGRRPRPGRWPRRADPRRRVAMTTTSLMSAAHSGYRSMSLTTAKHCSGVAATTMRSVASSATLAPLSSSASSPSTPRPAPGRRASGGWAAQPSTSCNAAASLCARRSQPKSFPRPAPGRPAHAPAERRRRRAAGAAPPASCPGSRGSSTTRPGLPVARPPRRPRRCARPPGARRTRPPPGRRSRSPPARGLAHRSRQAITKTSAAP